MKKWVRWHNEGSWNSLRTLIKEGSSSKWCPLPLKRKYARIAWRYLSSYRQGWTGELAEYAVRTAKSHRMVSGTLDAQLLELYESEIARLAYERAGGVVETDGSASSPRQGDDAPDRAAVVEEAQAIWG